MEGPARGFTADYFPAGSIFLASITVEGSARGISAGRSPQGYWLEKGLQMKVPLCEVRLEIFRLAPNDPQCGI